MCKRDRFNLLLWNPTLQIYNVNVALASYETTVEFA